MKVQSHIKSILSREGNHLEDKLVGITAMIKSLVLGRSGRANHGLRPNPASCLFLSIKFYWLRPCLFVDILSLAALTPQSRAGC